MNRSERARRRESRARITEDERRLVWRLAALLLDYPDEELLALLDLFGAAVHRIPSALRPPLLDLMTCLRATAPMDLGAAYVETFDLRRRASLHLTYYSCGDTRKRGVALLRFKHAYRQAGLEPADHELPDHLPLVLEFAATIDPVGGARLLGEYLPVLELLRLSLSDNGSRYAGVLAAVIATLPPLTTADRRRIAELAAEGPPAEEVGLEPFALHPARSGPGGAHP